MSTDNPTVGERNHDGGKHRLPGRQNSSLATMEPESDDSWLSPSATAGSDPRVAAALDEYLIPASDPHVSITLTVPE